ncbi:hypothetical protein MUN81_10465 [Hymenobacter sp. 5317J-9]|uniref:hypothetical protein n=1 Tax=Hymenobacter sp. 5317J-9 TaxID=2932250 RepID=UPI001FD70E7A|nr:hypothetical protein [Hymenobacter sp. 5317J-9]UOQ99902.1 hypothetical protein MUN81_10465 [Hymenobacter sp. 5317J-9]
MEQLVFAGNGVAYHRGMSAVLRTPGAFGAAGGKGGAKPGGAEPTTPVAKGTASGDLAPWGDANDFPQQVLAAMAKSTILKPVLDWKTRAVYGKGIVYGKVIGYKPDGSEIFQRVNDHVVKEFFRKSNLSRFGFEGIQGLMYFANAFPELVLSNDRSQITSICVQDTPYCRYSAQKPGEAAPQWVYISANWPEAKPGDEYTTRVPVLDPYYDVVETLRTDTRGFKYIYPLSLPSPGQALYQLAVWNVIIKSGWLDVAQAIPEFKKQLFINQLSIKYIIEADLRYWEWKYPDWAEKKEGDRKRIISEELDAFEKTMAGTDGAGKSVLAVTMPDPNGGPPISVFKVTAIDDKIKSGLYIEDSQEASSHIYTALQVDPTLSGISPGKGMGAGSGSDKRVAFNAFLATHAFHQDLLLEVLNLVRDYNGWDPELEFRFLNPEINTLDKNSETTTTTDA